MHTIYKVSVGGRPLLFIGMVLVIAGLQIFFTGFLAELLLNIMHNSSSRDGKMLEAPIKYASDNLKLTE